MSQPLSFAGYLAKKRMAVETISQHQGHVRYFMAWLYDSYLHMSEISYREILDYTDSLVQEGRSIRTVNRSLLSLEYWFDYLIALGERSVNPAARIRVRGTIRTVPHGLLERSELDELYERYEIRDERTHRNKVMLGLLVHQAVTRDELETLRPEHLKLREGKIQIPATGSLNGRVLRLEPHQVLDLQEYVLIVRPKLQRSSDRLFAARNDGESLKNTLLHLKYALKKINPNVRNAMQLRQSVIALWLKERNLRVVQYMAGHRYVSSTERYKTTNLEDLKEALAKFHPLK